MLGLATFPPTEPTEPTEPIEPIEPTKPTELMEWTKPAEAIALPLVQATVAAAAGKCHHLQILTNGERSCGPSTRMTH